VFCSGEFEKHLVAIDADYSDFAGGVVCADAAIDASTKLVTAARRYSQMASVHW
jgi:hypothetical protein